MNSYRKRLCRNNELSPSMSRVVIIRVQGRVVKAAFSDRLELFDFHDHFVPEGTGHLREGSDSSEASSSAFFDEGSDVEVKGA